MVFILLFLPIVTVFFLLIFHHRQLLHTLNLVSSIILTIIAMSLTKTVFLYDRIEYSAFGGLFYLDSLSIIMLDIVIVLSLVVSIYSVGFLDKEIADRRIDPRRLKVYYILMYSFIFTMMLALTVKNMGVMWIAIEATTLASAFLVGFYGDKQSLEAAWKYVIICSVGIAFALLGIIFLHLSSLEVLRDTQLLDWTALFANATLLESSILRLAFIFMLIGFGTKAGLAPMHTWLPGAHSQAPAPISALLSGVLLNSAMYGIIRTVAIVNKNLGSSLFAGRLLMALGLLSITTAAVFIITQREYKTLLAYSSIEHMGIIAFAIGMFTPASVFAALLHMLNHSFTKSMLFLCSGNVMQRYRTGNISKVRGMLKALPVTGTAFLLGLFAIAGSPPFSVFVSKLSVIAAAFANKSFATGVLLIILLAVVFAGIASNMFKMFYGEPSPQDTKSTDANIAGTAAIVMLLAVILVMGLYVPAEVRDMLFKAQEIITGGTV